MAAAGHKREQRRLMRDEGARIVVLFDADIVIGQSSHHQRRRFFADLFDGRRTEISLRTALEEFFFGWVISKLAPERAADGPVWAMAPEHFDEVVAWVDNVFDTSAAPLAEDLDPSLAQRLHQVLRRLTDDPWSDIDRELAPVLSMLGLPLAHKDAVGSEDIRRWVQPIVDRGLVLQTRPALHGPLAGVAWPRIDSDEAVHQLTRWRTLLWDAAEGAHSPSAVNNDARVLTALALHHTGSEGARLCPYLLTGSAYLWRAVAGRPLWLPADDGTAPDPLAPQMSDYILLPSAVLAADALWQPVAEEREAPSGSVPEWLPFDAEPGLLDRRRWFWCSVWSVLDAPARARCPWPDPFDGLPSGLPKAAQVPAGNFIATNVAQSAALAHVRERLSSELGRRALEALRRLEPGTADPQEQLAVLSELRRLRLHVELIELRLRAHHLREHRRESQRLVNALRTPPYVHFWGVADVEQLRNALVRIEDGSNEEELATLKARVYSLDRSAHLLVLAYAAAYARQERWDLAASAANYARATAVVHGELEGARSFVDGGEAELLELACLRRSATSVKHVDEALERLVSHRRAAGMRDDAVGRLFSLRLDVEAESLRLVRLSMPFFFNELVTRAARETFRAQVAKQLGAVRVLWERIGPALEPFGSHTDLQALRSSVRVRLQAAAVNLAWLRVAPTPKEAERLKAYEPRALASGAGDGDGLIRFVAERLAELAALDGPLDVDKWSLHPKHPLLARLTAAVVLGTESDTIDRRKVTEVLAHWSLQPFEHVYDAAWVRYARWLAARPEAPNAA